MRKFLAALLAVLVMLSCGIVQAGPKLSGARKTLFFYKNDSSNATVTAVAASDNNTVMTRLYSAVIDVATADIITIKCGSVTKGAFSFGANSGLSQIFYPFYIECRAISANLAGTVATTSGSATITGTSTTFTTDFGAGDRIVINTGDTLTISSVTNNSSMVATGNAATTVSGKTYQRGADNLNFVKGTAGTVFNASGWYEQDQ